MSDTGADDEATIEFVLALARALHHYGTPSYRLEEAVAVVCRRLDVTAELFATPTTIIVSFGHPAELRTRMMRVDGGETNLAKLADVDALADQVADGELSIRTGLERLAAITAAPPHWGRPISLAVHGVTAAAVAVFFHGSAVDVAAAAIAGLIVGTVGLFLSRSSAQTQVFELVGAFAAAFISGGAAALVPGVSSQVVTISALIPLLPGLSLTTAMIELATRNLISGTARLMSAVIVLLELVLGVAIGERAAAAVFAIPTGVAPVPLPAWAEWVALVAAAGAVTVVVQAHRRSMPWIMAACVTGVLGGRLGTAGLGPEIGVVGGAFALGVLCNLYARWLDRPAQVVMVPAVFLLVPGSVGFRGMSSLLGRDTITGVETTFAMFVVAMAIVAGLLVANATVSPRRVL